MLTTTPQRGSSDSRFDGTAAVVIVCWKPSARCDGTELTVSRTLVDVFYYRFDDGPVEP